MTKTFSKIETIFPKLSGTSYKCTSADTPAYNCIAWAAGENDRWWEPGHPFDVGYYWPSDATQGPEVSCLVEAYESIGYSVCTEDKAEPGFEKIAVYGRDDGTWTHAARQLPEGPWTSKLGPCEDIEHEHPDHLESRSYGLVHYYMKRPRF